MSRFIRIISIAVATLISIGALPHVALASDAPIVFVETPRLGGKVIGTFPIKAFATPSGDSASKISKWCLAVTGPSTVSLPSFYSGAVELLKDSNGCYSSQTADLRSISSSLNSSTWLNGTYTFNASVTDSNGRTSESSQTFVASNLDPLAKWVTPTSGQIVKGSFTLTAGASPTSSKTWISQWCFSISGPSSIELPTFKAGITPLVRGENGCFTSPPRDVRSVTASLDSTTWVDGTYVVTVRVKDLNGRVSNVASRTLISKQAPTISWTAPSTSSTLKGPGYFRVSATSSNTRLVKIVKWCLSVTGPSALSVAAVKFGSAVIGRDSGGCYASGTLDLKSLSAEFDSTPLANGTYVATFAVTDSNGKTSFSARSFTVMNGNPSVFWSTPASNSIVSKPFMLKGSANPFKPGTARISKWCITVTGPAQVILPSFNWGNQTLNKDSNSCFTSMSGSIENIWALFDPTSWAPGSYTFSAQVTDTNGRVSTVATKKIVKK